jgi:hypothetical protein
MRRRDDTAEAAFDIGMSRSDYVQFRDRWMKHVLGKDWLPEKHRLVAVRIALYVNFDEQFARPSVETIALDTACSVRTVVRAIANLDKEKLLRVERRKRGVNRYFLIL